MPDSRCDDLETLRRLTGAMTEAVDGTDPAVRVPACPEWTVEDLVDHLGRVHLWAEHCARVGSLPDPYPSRDTSAPLPRWYAGCAGTLLDGLSALDPDAPAWSFSREPGHGTVRFWRRRQVHETAVHLVDLLQAGGSFPTSGPVGHVPVLTAAQCADGVAEALEVFVPRMLVRRRDEPALDVVPVPEPVALRCTDTGQAWTVQVTEGSVRVREGADGAVATVQGPAAHLYLALWHRADRDLLQVTGDTGAGLRLLAAQLVP